MVKQTIILRKKANPKVVNLPSGRPFTSKWERISKKQLPIKIRVKRNKTIGPRKNNRRILLNLAAPGFRKIKNKRKKVTFDTLSAIYDRVNRPSQSGKGLGSNLAKAELELGSRGFSSEFGRKLINKGIDIIPNIFKFGASKLKNKNVRRAMQSEIADMIVQEAQNQAKNKYNSLL